MAQSYADVLCPDAPLAADCDQPKRRGDLVHIGVNAGPVFEIVAVEGRTAWVREPISFRGETLVALDRLRAA